jgi:aryl-alcohol dehydrogenase-like predicted oxidoreductase
MKFGPFGRTGLQVSRLAIGTATFGNQTDEATSHAMLDKAAAAGINFIDTADAYPIGADLGMVGRTEEITGRWLAGQRHKFIVGTKVASPMGAAAWDQGVSRKHLLDGIDASLRRLGTDYVDLYSLHFDDASVPLEESAEAMDVIVRHGKARYIGVSNFLAYRLARAIGIQETRRLTRYVCIQPRYNLLFREIERELLPLTLEEGVAVTPYNPLAGGLLSGRYKNQDQPNQGRFSMAHGAFGKIYQDRYWNDRTFSAVDMLGTIARQNNMGLPAMAIGWMLAHPAITSVILGASKVEQLDATLGAADQAIDPALKLQLDELTTEFRRGDAVR